MRVIVGVSILGLLLGCRDESGSSDPRPLTNDAADAGGASRDGGALGVGGAGGAAFCSGAGGSGGATCSTEYSLYAGQTFCPLSAAIASACSKCNVIGDVRSCPDRWLVNDGKYTFLGLTNVDVEFVFVYDKGGKLVGNLYWSANTGSGSSHGWTCMDGPANLDLAEVEAALPGSPFSLDSMCPGSPDASAD
jgi:hypothetical protein